MTPAIQSLRRYGPESVAYLMSEPDLRKSPRWTTVLEAVAQQKDAEYCGLYWHTELDQALAMFQHSLGWSTAARQLETKH